MRKFEKTKTYIMKNFIFVIIALFTLASCDSVNNLYSNIGKKQETLLNSKWVLADELGSTKNPTLMIEKDKVYGNASCNNYFSNDFILEPKTGNFSVKKIGSTKMACENMKVEDNYLQSLEAVTNYVFTGNTLELYKDNLLMLKFKKLQ